MTYTATEYTRSQMNGKLYRVGWHKFASRPLAERWADRRMADVAMMAPHWIHIKAYRSRRTLTAYRSDGNGKFDRVTFDHQKT